MPLSGVASHQQLSIPAQCTSCRADAWLPQGIVEFVYCCIKCGGALATGATMPPRKVTNPSIIAVGGPSPAASAPANGGAAPPGLRRRTASLPQVPVTATGLPSFADVPVPPRPAKAGPEVAERAWPASNLPPASPVLAALAEKPTVLVPSVAPPAPVPPPPPAPPPPLHDDVTVPERSAADLLKALTAPPPAAASSPWTPGGPAKSSGTTAPALQEIPDRPSGSNISAAVAPPTPSLATSNGGDAGHIAYSTWGPPVAPKSSSSSNGVSSNGAAPSAPAVEEAPPPEPISQPVPEATPLFSSVAGASRPDLDRTVETSRAGAPEPRRGGFPWALAVLVLLLAAGATAAMGWKRGWVPALGKWPLASTPAPAPEAPPPPKLPEVAAAPTPVAPAPSPEPVKPASAPAPEPAAPEPPAPEPKPATRVASVERPPHPAREVAPKETPAKEATGPKRAEAVKFQRNGYKALERGDVDGAVSDFKKSIALNPVAALAYRGLGAAYSAKGSTKEAAKAYRKYLALSPHAQDAAEVRALVQQLQ